MKIPSADNRLFTKTWVFCLPILFYPLYGNPFAYASYF